MYRHDNDTNQKRWVYFLKCPFIIQKAAMTCILHHCMKSLSQNNVTIIHTDEHTEN